MILGIGTDIVKIARIASLYNKHPNNFARKILTNQEIKIFSSFSLEKKQISYLAKRFAIKEAFVKALGTGFRKEVSFLDIEVINNNLGKPEIIISKQLEKHFRAGQFFAMQKTNKDYSIPNFFVSVSDEEEYVVAFVVIE